MGNYLTFGSANSSTYNVLLSGEGVFDAPKRDAETITIPGRDGAYVMDHGRFENIEVTYPAYTQEKTMSSFCTNLDNFRNVLSSYKGYQRLEDTFHPDEYRMAAFIDGIEIDPYLNTTASAMELKFNCKPQRFLKSGETAVTVANNGTISNPTLFDSHPLLAVKGYGTIGVGGKFIELQNITLGNILLTNRGNSARYEDGLVNNGDEITMEAGSVFTTRWDLSSTVTVTSITCTGAVNTTVNTWFKPHEIGISAIFPEQTFSAGTDKTISDTINVTLTYTKGGTTYTKTGTYEPSLEYTASLRRFGITESGTFTPLYWTNKVLAKAVEETSANSTVSALGNPTYIDLDIGEAYKIQNDNYVSCNQAVTIPAELPVLKSGSNTITYPNTVTEFKITPRWWKI